MEDETIMNISNSNGAFEVRYLFQNNKPYFMASDVVKCFGGYSSPSTLTKLRVSPDNIIKKMFISVRAETRNAFLLMKREYIPSFSIKVSLKKQRESSLFGSRIFPVN